MLPLLALLLLVPLDAAPTEPPAPQRDTVETPWAMVLDDGRLRLERDRTVRFEGRGHLAFDAGRRHVRVETDASLRAFVDGAAVRAPHALAAGDVLEWRAGADTWTVRLASTRELDAVTDATRIRDDRPTTPARIDTDEPTTFFLHLDARGGSTFIYPETDL